MSDTSAPVRVHERRNEAKVRVGTASVLLVIEHIHTSSRKPSPASPATVSAMPPRKRSAKASEEPASKRKKTSEMSRLVEQADLDADLLAPALDADPQPVASTSTATSAARYHVLLLRGVNVGGGSNRISPTELKAAVAEAGGTDVKTYLNSGNAVFRTDDRDIAEKLAAAIDLEVDLFVRTQDEINDLVAQLPYDADDPTKVHVAFLESAPKAEQLAALSQYDLGDDRFTAHTDHLYLSLPNGAGRSKLAGNWEKWLNTRGTARNWRTVLALKKLIDAS